MRPCGDFSPSFGNIPVPIISLVHLLLVVTVVTVVTIIYMTKLRHSD